MEHYVCRAVTELLDYMNVNFRVSEGEMIVSGQVYVAENLVDNYRYGNWTVFAPEVIENTEEQIPAIILNNDFETLPDKGMSNNDNFKISENTVLVKTEITQAGSYGLLVTGTDGKGNVKNSITTAFTVASGK